MLSLFFSLMMFALTPSAAAAAAPKPTPPPTPPANPCRCQTIPLKDWGK
jgi:hypothetical protein